MLGLNLSIIESWKSCDGDNTNLINYDLNQDSKILELGGYNGTWIRKMISKYDPFVFVIEPIPSFFQNIRNEFSSNPKFKILNVGVSDESRDGIMYLDNDSTSEHVSNSNPINVRFETMSRILEKFEIEDVDLLQINIEGEEYDLLEDLIKTGVINKFKNIQVQFHMGMDNYISRRDTIQSNLTANGFIKNFDFPFIWEGWSKL
jgi:FkbM family methyltransferase